MSISKLSALFLTISGLCATVGGAQAFQVFGDASPAGHKVAAALMLVSVIFAYLANSPIFKPEAVVAEKAAKAARFSGKVGVIALFLALAGTVSNCAHVRPIVACATDVVVAAIEDALSDPNWEAELAQLVVQDGAGVVECVVEQIISQAGTETSDSVKVAHAKAWKAKHSK